MNCSNSVFVSFSFGVYAVSSTSGLPDAAGGALLNICALAPTCGAEDELTANGPENAVWLADAVGCVAVWPKEDDWLVGSLKEKGWSDGGAENEVCWPADEGNGVWLADGDENGVWLAELDEGEAAALAVVPEPKSIKYKNVYIYEILQGFEVTYIWTFAISGTNKKLSDVQIMTTAACCRWPSPHGNELDWSQSASMSRLLTDKRCRIFFEQNIFFCLSSYYLEVFLKEKNIFSEFK